MLILSHCILNIYIYKIAFVALLYKENRVNVDYFFQTLTDKQYYFHILKFHEIAKCETKFPQH